jgi:hypothetical protein
MMVAAAAALPVAAVAAAAAPDRTILSKAGQQTQDLLRSGTVRRRFACGSQPEVN